MFWALIMDPKKKYSRTVNDEFTITMAAADPEAKVGTRGSVYIENEKGEHVVCTLTVGTTDQVRLDLEMTEGEEITLWTAGNFKVHLTGYLLPPSIDNGPDDFGSEDETDDEDFDGEEEEDSDDDEEEEDSDEGAGAQEDGDDDEEEEESDDDDDEDDEEEEESDDNDDAAAAAERQRLIEAEAAKQKKQKDKKRKREEDSAQKQAEAKKAKVAADKKAATEKAAAAAAPKKEKEKGPKKWNVGGVEITEFKTGDGRVAQNKNKVVVKYRGWLATTKKQFDKGKIDFKLGAGNVIKGWDLGVKGMKVGAQRRLTIPAKHGYGRGGAPPDIPPNATLMFDVQLVNIL